MKTIATIIPANFSYKFAFILFLFFCRNQKGAFQSNSSNSCWVEILKSFKYSPFDTLTENRKFQKFQPHSPSGSDFMAILSIFPAEFKDKMWFGTFSGYP